MDQSSDNMGVGVALVHFDEGLLMKFLEVIRLLEFHSEFAILFDKVVAVQVLVVHGCLNERTD